MKNTFPKQEKLCDYNQIRELFKSGKTIKEFPLKLIYNPIQTSCQTPVKVLVSVPKRIIRKAVKRNYIKRIIRENYRLHKSLFDVNSGQFAFAFLYMAKEKMTFEQVYQALTGLANQWNEIQQEDKNKE